MTNSRRSQSEKLVASRGRETDLHHVPVVLAPLPALAPRAPRRMAPRVTEQTGRFPDPALALARLARLPRRQRPQGALNRHGLRLARGVTPALFSPGRVDVRHHLPGRQPDQVHQRARPRSPRPLPPPPAPGPAAVEIGRANI